MRLNINGRDLEVADSVGERKLIAFLREDLGACGACTVLLDGEPMKICIKRVRDVAGHRMLTIEGMAAADGTLHPLQRAFVERGAIQCGFCTPGMVLVAHAFLLKNPRPTRDEIRKAINGNLCRCTGYQQIIDAIEEAAAHYRPAPEAAPAGPPSP